MLKVVFKAVLFVNLVFVSSSCFAAAPVTHVVLAEEWIKQHEKFSDAQKRSFILGTLFPDIRYLGVIERNKTHETGLTVKDLKNTSAEFERGKRLHSFVDEFRENLVVKWNIYSLICDVPGHRPGQKAMFLKLVEDEILFSKRHWNDIRKYFQTLDAGEKNYNISDADLKRWHANQDQFFKAPPSKALALLCAKEKGFANIPLSITKEWVTLIPEYAKDRRMIKYVEDLEQEFIKVYKQD